MSDIRIVADFHTHTKHSHGSGTIEDNVKAAIRRGLRAIAISDHGVGHLLYRIPDMDRYLREIEEIRDKYADQIIVYSGYEGNLQSMGGGKTDIPPAYADSIDIPSFGYHKMVRYPNPADWLHFVLPKRADKASIARNTQAIIDAMNASAAVFLTHPGYGLPIDKDALAKAAAEGDVILEINAKHPEFTESELADAADAGAMFIIGSDAHSPQRVGDFAAALDKVKRAGLAASQIVNSDENIDAFLERIDARRTSRGPRTFGEVLETVQEREDD